MKFRLGVLLVVLIGIAMRVSPAFAYWMLKYVLVGPAVRLKHRPKVYGLENLPRNSVNVLAPKHISHTDVPLLAACLPGRLIFVAKKELFGIPVLGRLMVTTQNISVDRNDPRDFPVMRNKAVKTLNDGFNVVIFPEGTRCRGRLGNVNSGAASIAKKADCYVVPIGIDDEDGHRCIRIGEPFMVKSVTDATMKLRAELAHLSNLS